MKKQKVMSQMKGKEKNPEEQVNEVEIGSLPGKQFRIRMVKMIEDLGKIMEKMQEMFTKDLEELNDKQTEMNNTLEEINSRIRMKKKKKKRTQPKTPLDSIKHTNICIIGVPEGEEREKGPDKIFAEIIAENFPYKGGLIL